MPTAPNPEFLDGQTPCITMAGQKWPIPKFKLRQLQRIVPMMTEVAVDFSLAGQSLDPAAMRDGRAVFKLSESQFEKVMRIVHVALTRAHPQLTWDDFLEWEIDINELMNAIAVIAEAASLKKKNEGAPEEGEA
jgi:hypothetical protein